MISATITSPTEPRTSTTSSRDSSAITSAPVSGRTPPTAIAGGAPSHTIAGGEVIIQRPKAARNQFHATAMLNDLGALFRAAAIERAATCYPATSHFRAI